MGGAGVLVLVVGEDDVARRDPQMGRWRLLLRRKVLLLRPLLRCPWAGSSCCGGGDQMPPAQPQDLPRRPLGSGETGSNSSSSASFSWAMCCHHDSGAAGGGWAAASTASQSLISSSTRERRDAS